jgi:hypothetical protein
MTLLQSWADSLTLFKPKNLQLFALVTLKSIIEAYKLYAIYWSWLFGLIIISCMIPFFYSWSGASILAMMVCSGWLLKLLLFALSMVTRPSIEKKDCAYFRYQMRSSWLMMLFLLLPLLTFIEFFLWFIFLFMLLYTQFSLLLTFIFLPVFLLSLVFFILFFLDSAKGVKGFFYSLCNMIKMVVYNAPLLLLIVLFLGSLMYLLWQLIVYIVLPFWDESKHSIVTVFVLYRVGEALLLPIIVCTYSNIYIKKVHDQFDLYFKRS